MGCLRSHQYLMKNQDNFGRFSMFHSQARLFDESFDYEYQEQKTSIEMMNFLPALQSFPV